MFWATVNILGKKQFLTFFCIFCFPPKLINRQVLLIKFFNIRIDSNTALEVDRSRDGKELSVSVEHIDKGAE